ncbi:MAG: endonuclease/exonuclease/phosphatase family protein [Rhizobiales bacterium]|nr:endonuclease/exonuclease/phosphatase family protein [Hyphomicrobiales bacterium]
MRRRKRGGGRFECNVGLLIGVGGLAASRLGHLWISFDVFSQFTLQFAIVTVAFALGRIMPRARLFVAFLVLVAGIGAIGAWPHVASREPWIVSELKAGERAVTVASFNTLYDNEQADAVRAEIERLDADIVTLIEFGPNKHGLLKTLAARYPHQAECFAMDYCHLAILSKFPLTDSNGRTGWDGPPIIMAKLGPEFGGLTVIGVHTLRFPHARAQFRQIKALADLIDTLPGPKLVMGDINATPFSRITATLVNQTGLMRLTSLPTWPSHARLPQMAIDHIFASPGIRILESERIGQTAGSDHYPITMKLAVPAPASSP